MKKWLCIICHICLLSFFLTQKDALKICSEVVTLQRILCILACVFFVFWDKVLCILLLGTLVWKHKHMELAICWTFPLFSECDLLHALHSPFEDASDFLSSMKPCYFIFIHFVLFLRFWFFILSRVWWNIYPPKRVPSSRRTDEFDDCSHFSCIYLVPPPMLCLISKIVQTIM